ncbi:MAG: RusA family crossover junction endodeoxyribonuclease, partial [Candidatus Methanofastidiosa archaeon]|nr:RusA family crossover junction endodeoxyribonuclease [Candidatus Methanofastidiosa archaeon]
MSKINTKPVTFGGKTNEGSPYWKFKNDIKQAFENHERIDSEFGIEITLYVERSRIRKNRNDLDNFLKPVIDALSDISIIEEHKMKSIRIERVLVEDSSEEG